MSDSTERDEATLVTIGAPAAGRGIDRATFLKRSMMFGVASAATGSVLAACGGGKGDASGDASPTPTPGSNASAGGIRQARQPRRQVQGPDHRGARQHLP